MTDPSGQAAPDQAAPDQADPGLPGVSYVMPVLNEVTHVEAAIASLLDQDYTGPFDVIVALGPSIDGTTELVGRLSSVDPRIRVIENPTGSTPSGLNVAIAASRYPVVVRVDAHSLLPRDYTRVAVEALLRTDAANVGGIMKAEGTTAFERAVAHAYGSKAGLGGGAHHVGGVEGPAETVYLGVFQRSWLTRVGLFNKDIRRGQDWELNRRLREAGGTVWFTPRLVVTYRPRPSLERLARQFFSTGLWRGELARRFFTANALKYFVPPVMVAAVVLGLAVGAVGLATGTWLTLGFVVPLVYLVFVAVAAVGAARSQGRRAGAWFLVVLPCIHFSWGLGFILGFLKLTKNITAHTGR
ncbi:glycosyltransferase family 2 protein [Herbiconiux sp. CPCC 205716]|uniref:Glycosyltransferase family 2 protein n=1 Tax=Herbiconiux gentiana TaxID=2970912 RepID=A0ABT2GJU5_9MICO|nr:glycosyltransferase family 2 protein [Herbiconiux gentiana]MCS5715204.1 glycosyltransferase family 2 protein [Herbiconiux gentiana]